MKKIIIGFLFFTVPAFCGFSQDTQAKDYTYSFQVKPGMYLIAFFINGMTSDNDIDIDETYYIIPIDIEFQYKIHSNITLFFNPNIWFYNNAYKKNAFDINLTTGIFYRPLGTGLKGFYIAANTIIGYSSQNYHYSQYELYPESFGDFTYWSSRWVIYEEKQKYFNIGYMLEGGYEWIFKNGFTLTLGGGIDKVYPIKLGDYKYENETPGAYLYGLNLFKLPFDFRLRASIGYSF